MNNYVQPGKTIRKTMSGSALSSGDLTFVGDVPAVAIADIADGGTGECQICGVFSLTKVSAQAWTQGDRLYYDASLGKVTNVKDTDTKFVGFAHSAAANPSATGDVLLVGPTAQAAIVAFSAGSNLVGVDGTGSNAAPLAGTETRLDAIDTAIAAIIVALKNAGLMASS